ncbi:efflux RND transporter periplasmic adaptor subunit [Roseateles cellulosilyticus]|uniref:Efflux RND transporter periplasmic adaptor subunit n=1 Tax=Pelomonas cellulosilytica TaxID=2906762 RepID=A0ABS8XUX8_9BURK|nr:efflux RND transporter periplasmic adaptor subunit [Pelomonas sp. P8]MCE4554697.1 efflux RND transporter periplasmic adaptor subunit [Pelomonas sp. P8]
MNRPCLRAIGAATLSLLLLSACKPKQDGPDGPASAATAPSVLTVEVVSPTSQSWPQTVQANGALAAWQEVVVSPETGGLRIAELLVDVGARVKRGQLLARLADESLQNDLSKQQALVAQAQASLDQAVSNVQRAKQVESAGGLSAQAIEQYRITEATSRASLASAKADLAATQLKLRQSRITAPDDGLVSSRTGVLGNVVNAGTELFRLVRQSRVEWRAEVDARQLAVIKEGQRANVSLPTGQTVEGRVRLVGPVLSTNTGRALVYVGLPTDSVARVGMFADGVFELPVRPALTLPQSALVARDGRDYAYLVDANGKVRSVVVTVGRRQQQRVEVLAGVPANALVVASGGAFLSDGARVTVVAASAASAVSR